jgi:hypothetical protein
LKFGPFNLFSETVINCFISQNKNELIMSRSSEKMAFGKSKLLTSVIKNFFIVGMVILSHFTLHAQAPNLGATSDFALFTASGAFNNVGASTVVTGDVGTNVGAFNAFPPGTLIGSRHIADAVSAQAATDVLTAYTYLDGLTCGMVLGTTLGSGQTLTPNIYCLGAASTINGNLVLDAQGDPNANFIFQIDGALSTTTLSNVQLINGASACNVFWQINGAVALGDSSVFVGTMLVQGAINLLQRATLNGRGLSTAGAISMAENIVNIPGGLPPTPSVITADGPTTFCEGDSVTLTGNVGGIWSNGLSTTSIVVMESGDYFVINANGCGIDTSNIIIVTVFADTLPPDIVCPPDITIQLDPSTCDTLVTFALATATDNCSDPADITITSDIISGSLFGIGEQVVTFEATDMAENIATCSFTVTILDFINPSLGCKDVNFSLDENCEGELTPTLVLTGWEDLSGVPQLGCDGLFDITIEGKNGEILGNIITNDLLGKTLEYTITNVNGFICSGSLNVEDKIKPSFICPSVPLNINCLTDLSTVAPPVVVDNCSGAVAVLVNEVHETLQCDLNYIGTITRTWKAVDGAGNESVVLCTQVINLLRSNTDGITAPPANVTLQCSESYEVDDKGFKYPSPNETGVPILDTTPLYPLSQLNMIYCNATIDYTDVLVIDTKCKKRILRTWMITEWWCSTAVQKFISMQIIDIVDTIPPVIPSLDNIIVTTETRSCSATVLLPTLNITDNCTEVYNVFVNVSLNGVPSGYIGGNGGSITLVSGTHTITYSAIDECGNQSEMSYRITVQDDTDPVAICDQSTTISLKTNGYTEVTATAIDDGSFDECGAVTLQVRRMEDPCGFGQDTAWFDKVGFCCLDANTTRMVQLLVTDAGGRTNICMVNVQIQEKVDPQITCLADITIEDCNFTFDPQNPAAYFGEILIEDNCPANNILREDVKDNRNQCGIGTVVRSTSVLQGGITYATCVQTITFRNDEPFYINQNDALDPNDDIEWPGDYVALSQCTALGLDPSITGEPTFTEDACDLVGMRFDDVLYPFTTNGACLKIIRTWTVIDWCQTNINGINLTWTYDQEIKVIDNAVPTITSPDTSKLVLTYDHTCLDGPIELTASATDCTPNNELKWNYVVTNEGLVFRTGTGNNASGRYSVGIYNITFTVEDRCGNLAMTSYDFEIRNAKTPTAVCKYGLSAPLGLMDSDGNGSGDTIMVVLKPEYFNNKSYHVCGYDLSLSFSSDLADTIVSFSCADLGTQTIEMWVTDVNGNTSYCETFVDIQDSEGLCPSMLFTNVSGRTLTENDVEIKDVIVEMKGSELAPIYTNINGHYAFAPMPTGGNYQVIPSKDGDDKNGVSTLDIVMIQRHILGIEKLKGPYQILAADVNHNETVTAADLIELRKLILGLIPSFSNNKSWRFVDASYQFVDKQDPWMTSFSEWYNIEELSNQMDINFVGIKVGDVNGNASSNNLQNNLLENRSKLNVIMDDRNVVKGDIVEIPVMVPSHQMIYGMQMAWKSNGLIIREIKDGALGIGIEDYAVTDINHSGMSVSLPEGVNVHGNDILFILEVEAMKTGKLSDMLQLSETVRPEIYVADMESSSLGISFRSKPETDFLVKSVAPNPWNTNTNISFELPQDGMVSFKVKDYTGRKVISTIDQYKAGNNTIYLNKSDIGQAGVYVYELRYGDKVVSGKMIMID